MLQFVQYFLSRVIVSRKPFYIVAVVGIFLTLPTILFAGRMEVDSNFDGKVCNRSGSILQV
jgi:hypothetical protein